jgi:hypothetical protein
VLSERKVLTFESLAAALEKLYANKKQCCAVAKAFYQRATQPEKKWQSIAKRWHTLFQEALNT